MSKALGKISYYGSLLRDKKISCTELTTSFLNEIKENNKQLNAYVTVTEDEALRTAAAVDKKIADGQQLCALEGIPMTLKDNITTSGIETTCCSKMLKGYVPVYDATVWSLLKQQNSVLLGKTNMDEFAMGSTCENSCFGGAANPHDIKRVAGGSSGGVASAVAANLATFGLGSDTGGSIRQPASFCGLVGLKPTYGAFSRYGLIAFASSFDQIGPLTTSVEDAAIVFDALAQKDKHDSTSKGRIGEPVTASLKKDIKGLKIGVARHYLQNSDEDVQKAVESSIAVYKSLGAEITDVDMSFLEYALPVYYILACAEASSNLGRFDGIRYGSKIEEYKDLNEMICKTRSEGFGAEVKRRILLGTYVLSAGYYDAYYKKAQNLRGKILHVFKNAFEKCDVILTPTVPTTAFEFGASEDNVRTYFSDICTVPVNIAGLPAVSVPCSFNDKKLPVGLQLIGKSFDEATILNTSWQLENAVKINTVTDWGVHI